MPLTQQKHYIVGYHDTEYQHYEICEYATDSYEAIKNSKEEKIELNFFQITH